MKRILVFDSNPDRRDQHCLVLKKIGLIAHKWQDQTIVSYSSGNEDSAGALKSWDLILLHATGVDARHFADQKIVGPVLHYSGEGGNNAKLWVPRPVDTGSELSRDELQRFTDLFFSDGGTIEATITRVWSHATSLALRLLCEAWTFVDEKRSANGFVVNAPGNINEWLKPFGTNQPADVCKLMGSVQLEAAAKALFDEIGSRRQNRKRIRAAIEIFLKT